MVWRKISDRQRNDSRYGLFFLKIVCLQLPLSHHESGTLTSFILYTVTVSFALGALSELYSDFMKAVGSSEKVFQLIDRKPKIAPFGGQRLSTEINGTVEFESVSFAYPTRSEQVSCLKVIFIFILQIFFLIVGLARIIIEIRTWQSCGTVSYTHLTLPTICSV